MVMVEVSVPVLNRKLDFELDEETKIRMLTEEILEMLCRSEKRSILAHSGQFCLSSQDLETVLNPDATLQDYRIWSGARLILT